MIYVPPPDEEARIALFNLFLSGRPISSDVNTKLLASATRNYVASDIEALVNNAARMALKKKSDITFKILIDTINSMSPSVSDELIKRYNKSRE